jgi:HD-like signal output (HDOD) protein
MNSAEDNASALAFLQRLAKEVSDGSIDLPCFPDVVVRISLALADANTNADRIVTIVGAEPRLAARILQTANSAAFNSTGKTVTELRSAITRIGQQIVQGTAMSYAMQQMKNEESLRPIAEPLEQLWNRSIAVASLSRLIAAKTKVNADEAFLTGLLHGIGHLYILARSAALPGHGQSVMQAVAGWHASIGKAVLESWGFAEALCEAVGEQADGERRKKHSPTLTDILIASLVLADTLQMPEPRAIGADGINAFLSIGVTPSDCAVILSQAEEQIRLVHEALG